MKKIALFAALLFGCGNIFAQKTVEVKSVSIAQTVNLTNLKSEIKALQAQYHKQMNAAEATMTKLKAKLEAAMKELESKDKLENFEIQNLMSTYNQAETLSSSVRKKLDDTTAGVIGKIN